jgi:HrpA-like RNA helicase
MEIPSVLKLELSEIYLSLCAVDEIPQSIPWLEFPSESSFLKTKEFLVEADLIDKNNKITTKGLEVSKFPLSPSLGLGLIEAKRYGCLPAFSLILAYIDDRSPIIDKEFKEDIIVSQDSETFLENEASLNNSDLKLLLLIWVFAKRSLFSFKSCSNAGVHSNRCKIADQLAIRYCKLADTNVTDFSFLKTKKLPLVLLKIFSHQLAYSLSRGKKTFQSLNGSTFHLSKRSRVKDSNWVLPLKITEKIIKGQVSLEMEFVTEINEEDVISLFEKTILHKNEVF